MTRLDKWRIMMTAAALVTATSGAGAQDVDAGRQIAARECAGCHGASQPTGLSIQGVLVPSFSDIAHRPYRTRERLKSYLMIPRHPMPGLVLREDEVNRLVDYILSFK